VDWPAIMRDNYVMTNVDTVINAHVYHAASILASLAQIVNHTEEISYFQSAAEQIYQNVNSKLVNGSGMYHFPLFFSFLSFYFLFYFCFCFVFFSPKVQKKKEKEKLGSMQKLEFGNAECRTTRTFSTFSTEIFPSLKKGK
jgi:hypothetical protein